jgi:hypothetical protein
MQTASQVTRWYPLDGGIGFGRIRVSLLFRSVETRLPPNLLGWDVGTFEFLSKKIEASGIGKAGNVKIHTGGSSGKLGKDIAESSANGTSWATSQKNGTPVRFPVKYRYRSPIAFEFSTSGSRKPDAYATIWLKDLVDNEKTDFDIPIWSTKNPARILHNYITEENFKELSRVDDLKEVGRLKFSGRFKAGIDEDHASFATDNDARETQESWEACHAEGVRDRIVTKELPEDVQKLHDDALIKERDVLMQMPIEERKKWLSKDGTDWIKVENPEELADEYLRRKTQKTSSFNKSSADHESDEESDSESEAEADEGLKPNETIAEHGKEEQYNDPTGNKDADVSVANGSLPKKGPMKEYRTNEKDLHRKQRGLMQWKPARNARFAKDELKFGVQKIKGKFGMNGREPDVEAEL